MHVDKGAAKLLEHTKITGDMLVGELAGRIDVAGQPPRHRRAFEQPSIHIDPVAAGTGQDPLQHKIVIVGTQHVFSAQVVEQRMR